MIFRPVIAVALLLLPLTTPAEAWRFAAFGDSRGGSDGSGVNTDILGKLATAVVAEKPEFVVFPGDLIFGHADRKNLGDEGALKRMQSELAVWRATMEPLYAAGIPVYPVRGNHETTQRDPDHSGKADHRPVWPRTKETWDAIFSGPDLLPQNGPDTEKNVTYSVTHKNAFILGLDLYTYATPGTQMNPDGSIPYGALHQVDQAWLDQQLAANQQPHIFSFAHEPAFKVDHLDCMQGDSSFGMDLSKERDVFWNSLRKAGSRVFFGGHDHGFAHARIDDGDGNPDNDIHQVIVGTAGAGKNVNAVYDGYNGAFKPVPVSQGNVYGFVMIDIDGPNAKLTFHKMVDEATPAFEKEVILEYRAGE